MSNIANTNLSPYNDDFDPKKNFYRILFKPAVAVQARELTQTQDILQNQINWSASALYKDGSVIQGCSIEYIDDLNYIGINDQFTNNSALAQNDPSLIGAVILGQTSGVQALLVAAQTGFIRQTPGRFFIRYTAPGPNGSVFLPGETLNVYGNTSSYIEDVILSVANAASFSNSVGQVVSDVQTGNTANVNARAIIVSVNANTNQIIVNNIQRRFAIGDTLILYSNNAVNTAIANVGYNVSELIGSINVLTSNTNGIAISNSEISGLAYGAYVSDGIIFHQGFFLEVEPQTVIINPNSNDPSGMLLGFQTTPNIVTAYGDGSLFDNAAGFPNYNAPGADRLQLVSTLVAVAANSISNSTPFFPVVEFSNSGVAFDNTSPEYSALGDTLAERTYEEAGNFIVSPFAISSAPNASDIDSVIYEVAPGIAYVDGYRNQLLTNLQVPGERGDDVVSFTDQIVTMSYGNYVVVNEVRGVFPTTSDGVVTFYNAPQDAVTNNLLPSSTPTGTAIGTANILAMVYNSGTKGSANCSYAMYLFNIQMSNSSYSFANVQSIAANVGGVYAYADIPTGTNATLQETNYTPLLFSVGAVAVKTLENANGVSQNEYYYVASNTTVSLTSGGIVTWQVPAGGGILGFTNGSQGSEAEVELVLTANAITSNLIANGVTTYANGLITATGIGALFYPGEGVIIGANTYPVTSVIDANDIMVSGGLVASANQAVARFHYAGSHVPLDQVDRTLTVNANNQATINLGATYTDAPVAATVKFYALQNQAVQMQKVVNRSTVVVIQTANTGTDTGPWNLGIPDVFRLSGVFIAQGSPGSFNFDFTTNCANDFTLDDGQRDVFYDHAKLSLSPVANPNTYANSYLVVLVDHFTANTATGHGFFSVDSYPVDDTATANTLATINTWDIPSYYCSSLAKTFELRDTLDFRPYKQATANITGVFSLATVSPSTTSAFNSNTTSYQPFPGQNFQLNYTNYLGRCDVLTLTSGGIFELVRGSSSLTPIFPAVSNSSLAIANITVPPYPSLTDLESAHTSNTEYQISISILHHQRYTMSDIAHLDQRITQLEYYTTLNTLQVVAANTNIVSNTGLQQFKNGIFVDPFNDHSFGRVDDPQYAIAIDSQSGIARPLFQPEFFEMTYDSTKSAGITQVGNVLMMSYGEASYISQGSATESRSLSGAPQTFAGKLTLYPTSWSEVEVLAPAVNILVTDTASKALVNMTTPPLTSVYGWWRGNTAVSNTNYNNLANNGTITLNGGTTTANSTNGIQPYIRSKVIAFSAVGLKPYTTFDVYIDDVDMAQYVALGQFSGLAGATDSTVVSRTQMWSTPLESDSRGNLQGQISIPAFRFKAGLHTVKLISYETDAVTGAQISSAAAQFNVTITYETPPPIVIKVPFPPAPNTQPVVPPSTNTVANTVPAPAPAPTGPKASFAYSGSLYATSPANFSITFTDKSSKGTGAITSWAWNFGNGVTSAAQNPGAITFGNSGSGAGTQTYTITLKVTDINGLTSTYSENLTMVKLAPPPTASINITAISGSTILTDGTIGGVTQANINMHASTTQTYAGAYFTWNINVISGNTLTSANVSGTANNLCIPTLVSTNAAQNCTSTFIITLDYQYSNGYVIATTNTQFQLWTLQSASSSWPYVLQFSKQGTSTLKGSTGGGGDGGIGGCLSADCYVDDTTKVIDMQRGMSIDTWTPGEPLQPLSYPCMQIGQARWTTGVRLISESGVSLTCSTSTPFNLPSATDDLKDGDWAYAPDMLGQEVLVLHYEDGNPIVTWETIVEVEDVGSIYVVPLGFDDRSFVGSDNPTDGFMFSHNLMKILRNNIF